MKTILDLLPVYFSIIEKEKENSELYKWEAIQHFQEHWDINVPDDEFHEMFKKALGKRANLIYPNSYNFLNYLAKEMPKDARELMRNLFDDETPIETRITNHRESADRFLPELKKRIGKDKFQHQQDERTISFLLTLYKPEKYYLYKDNVYQAYCKFLGVETKSAGEKYFHFSQLGDQAKLLLNDNDALKNSTLVKDLRNNFSFDSDNLIFQDIIYRTLIVAQKEELDKELLTQITEDIKSRLFEIQHELVRHKWLNNDTPKFRQVEIFPDGSEHPLHYELMKHKDIAWEFHPEGNRKHKEFMEPFIRGYDKTKYKLVQWKYAVTGPYKAGEFHKISPRKRFKVEPKGANYDQMIELLTNQFIELYNDTNDRLINYLKNDPTISKEIAKIPTNMKQFPLNQILYGPPGTGKTYSTIDKVVEICCPDDYIMENHEANKIVYDQLINDGRVMFTTFHQSMSYEDFIEGIKPIINEADNETIKYEIQPGIFKQIAQTAKTPKTKSTTSIDWDKVNYFKMSIGGKNRPDIHNWCIENNVVGLSWGGEEDLSQLLTKGLPEWKKYRDDFKKLFPKTAEDKSYSIQASYILNKMNIGDIVVISKGNHIIDAIGKITGGYFFDDQTPTDMFHFRKVEWIAKDLDASPEKFFDKQISQQSIYEFYDMNIKKEAFKALTSSEETEEKPYVLVIDEINRGNVSAIFGELITLIENDKRLGMPNEIKVTLPYSKEKFGVPPNLFIIGTMNTADRSVEALDTALRRRFSFTEMPPLYDINNENATLQYHYANATGAAILKTINSRIEKLLDRDHLIGHSYFLMPRNGEVEKKLIDSFYRNIIPLLQEYFYGDYAKIGAVLGSGFVYKNENNEVTFGDGFDNEDFGEKDVYQIIDYRDDNNPLNKQNLTFEKAIRLLMNQKIIE